MSALPPGIGKLWPTKTLDKLYDDALSGPAKQVGQFSTDLLKTARLLLTPFQLGSAFQDRFEGLISRIRTRVPEERYMDAPAEVVGPALEQMRFLHESNPLWQMFEELLTASVDTAEISKVHPAFAHLIAHLCRDEAVLLYELRDREFKVVDTLELDRAANQFKNRKIEENEVPLCHLVQPEQIQLYYSHLDSLNLVEWPVLKQEPILDSTKVQIGVRRFTTMRLKDFGRSFVTACIPKDGFKSARIEA